MVEKKVKLLRKNFRLNGKTIIDHIKRNHLNPVNPAGEKDLCAFCGTGENLTKEHVLPKWCFEHDPKRFFETLINEQRQTFIETVIPACNTCNNETLAGLEGYIQNLFKNTDLKREYFEFEDSLNVIRWLEIIDYKFQILNFRRKFKKKKSAAYVPLFRDVPISVMRLNINLSPFVAMAQLRESQLRIKKRNKDSNYFSLVFWRSKNKESLFFHSMNEFIFLEFPEYQMAVFYFLKKEFKSNYDVEKEAKEIIVKTYG